MMTGAAFTGSRTPPICAASLKCTRLPTCAHDPTSAWESTRVPSSTYAPTLINIGGMQITDGAKYAPNSTDEPTGNTHQRSATEIVLAGQRALSPIIRNDHH